LSTQVNEILLSGMRSMLTAHLRGSPAPFPAKDQVEFGLRLIAVTPVGQVMSRSIDSNPGMLGQRSAADAMGAVYAMLVATSTDEFRRLSDLYQVDLPAFEQFNRSPAGG
jgi:hypothetical protein